MSHNGRRWMVAALQEVEGGGLGKKRKGVWVAVVVGNVSVVL